MIIKVKVKPNSKEQVVEQVAPDTFLVRLKSPPVDDKANQELIQILAQYFEVPKSRIRIKSGRTGKQKLVEID